MSNSDKFILMLTINTVVILFVVVSCTYWIMQAVERIEKKTDWLQVCIDVIDENISGDDDDPDPGDEDDDVAPSNVIAIGKSRKAA